MKHERAGMVYLIGAGPGDPGLITVRGAHLLARADVVVTDRLANPTLLESARADAEIVYAGKSSCDHYLTQDEIIAVLIDRAQQGKVVARLKGGDPFVFGRGGEEAVALAEVGIRFEVVPGISSSVAVPAYAGIPVTHRFDAASFAIITGHEAPDKSNSDIKWDKISTAVDTLVFLMGVENLENIIEQLVANDRPANTPVAVIRWGTHPSQQTVVGTLSDIVARCETAGVKPPAVTIVGEVVKLRETISWFETKLLFGKRVLVTRASHQASALTNELRELGADVIEIPVIKFVPPDDYDIVDAAIMRSEGFDWVLFTSANGVDWFVKRLFELGLDIRAMGKAKIGAIGPKTASALENLRLKVDYVPSEYIAEAVLNEFPEDVGSKAILIPRASEARDELPDGLRAKGAEVVVAPVYKTVADESQRDTLRDTLCGGNLDIITFTSASTVTNFLSLAEDIKVPKSMSIACIGPITADAARAGGLEPAIIAEEYTIEGLVQEIASNLNKR
ncbi:MAG: uroporphyrinogen-III C-methyltransferase [Armatimonadota bacterium]|nr:uroporphyrinogen-III C-methyltransferase [bacterium]